MLVCWHRLSWSGRLHTPGLGDFTGSAFIPLGRFYIRLHTPGVWRGGGAFICQGAMWMDLPRTDNPKIKLILNSASLQHRLIKRPDMPSKSSTASHFVKPVIPFWVWVQGLLLYNVLLYITVHVLLMPQHSCLLLLCLWCQDFYSNCRDFLRNVHLQP